MKITVVVNTYPRLKRDSDLIRCLDSIFAQSYKDFSVVVVENFENTSEVCKVTNNYSADKLLVICDAKKRLSYLFNVGWCVAKTEFVAFLADDAEACDGWLENIVKELKQNPEVGVATGPLPSQCYPVGEMHRLYLASQRNWFLRLAAWPYLTWVCEGNILKPGYLFESGAYSLGTALSESVTFDRQEIDLATTTSMGMRRDLLKKLGGFDERFNFNHADGDLFIRVTHAGYKIIFNPKICAKHYLRLGPSRNAYFIGKDTGLFYRKNIRPKSVHGLGGALLNVGVLNLYWVYSAIRLRDVRQLRGIVGFFEGLLG